MLRTNVVLRELSEGAYNLTAVAKECRGNFSDSSTKASGIVVATAGAVAEAIIARESVGGSVRLAQMANDGDPVKEAAGNSTYK